MSNQFINEEMQVVRKTLSMLLVSAMTVSWERCEVENIRNKYH